MKTTLSSLACVALLAITLASAGENASSQPEYFIRPLVAYVKPTDGQSTTGYGFAAGGSFGSQREHELSFEWNYAKWDESLADPSLSIRGSVKCMPYLLNYRHYFSPASPKLRFYAGASAGMTSVGASVNAVSSGETFNWSETVWSATYAGAVGCKVKLSDKADLDLGYRYQSIKGPTFNVVGTDVALDDIKINIVYLGVGYRF